MMWRAIMEYRDAYRPIATTSNTTRWCVCLGNVSQNKRIGTARRSCKENRVPTRLLWEARK